MTEERTLNELTQVGMEFDHFDTIPSPPPIMESSPCASLAELHASLKKPVEEEPVST